MDVEAIKAGQRALWAMGDFPEISKYIEPASLVIIEETGIGPGDRVLDVACGTGNLAVPAAKAGASVVGIDITPELLEVAKARVAEEGVEVELAEGDAEALEFADGLFDHVVSSFGMIFAPQHEVAAAEMVRTAKPGGRVALTAWTPEGMNGQLFGIVGSHMPPPPEKMPSPVDWGNEQYIADRFEPAGELDWQMSRLTVTGKADSVEDWMDYQAEKLAPLVMARMALEPQGKWQDLYDDLLAHYAEQNIATDGSYEAEAEYLLAVGTLAG